MNVLFHTHRTPSGPAASTAAVVSVTKTARCAMSCSELEFLRLHAIGGDRNDIDALVARYPL